jgi:gliding motility-associated-like protein
MKRKILSGLIACLPFLAFSQINVTPNAGATSLAQTIAGNGVTISNATLNCGASGSGDFTYTGANLGMTSGIVLTTGFATDAANAGSFFCSQTTGNSFSDPDLIAIDATATNDVCILEFDFVPICNSISITFVFGSEEYPTFVGSFNDAFGIFLTGPNPGGGTYNSTNIGTLPSGTPVSINNVNAGSNSAYFVDNYSNPNNDVAYDGYTVPITSVAQVAPCSTYHIKIGIADAIDQAYDSGVFIGNNAVSCQNAPAVTASATPTGCGGNTGSATATVTNYTGTATYNWQPGGQTTATATNLSAGTYTCSVGLQLSCGVITQTVTATVGNNGPVINVSATGSNPLCSGGSNGSATVTVNGGTAPYTYAWNTTPVQTTATAGSLGAGTYSVTVTDNGGCVSGTTVTLTNPAPIVATVTTTPAQCSASNGAAGASVNSGGTAPFSYAWSTTPLQTTQVASNLAPGIYTVVISDVNTCTAVATGTVGVQNSGWTLSAATATNVSCFGGSDGGASFTINNPGSSTFTYSWNTTPPQSTAIAANVGAGSYTCTVTDNTGCAQSVSVSISQPAQLVVNTSQAPTICTGSVGSATATASGGTAPYQYAWTSTPVQNTATATNLPAGVFTVTVTDGKGCSVAAPVTIGTTVQTPQATGTVTPSKCGSPNGGVTVTNVSGGTAPYSFSWNANPVQTTQNLVNVTPGNYTLSIIDQNGCTGTYAQTVTNVIGLPLTVASTADICNSSIGSATVSANGTPPYTYYWSTSPPLMTPTIGNVPAGSYFVVVTDNYGCADSISVFVNNVNEILSASFNIYPDEIYAGEQVTITVGMNSGWSLDSALLSDGNLSFNTNSLVHTFNQYGLYYASYFFTSQYGCRDSIVYPIKVTDFMTLYFPNAFSPNGDGLNDVFKGQGTFIKSFEMVIYDRWGQLILKTNDIDKSWNGEYHGADAPQDTYVYKGKASDIFGRHVSFQGQIHLVR